MRSAKTIAPRDTLNDTVLPAVRTTLATARDKSAEFLDSDVAHEARRRGIAVVKAARGDVVVARAGRRWRFGLGMVLAGTGLGLAATWVARRLATPVESYTMPAPSGTVTSETMPSNVTMTNDDVDLRSGMRT